MGKVDPRRGTVPLFRKPSVRKPPTLPAQEPQQLPIDTLEMAREIGRTIAQELKSLIQPINPQLLASRMGAKLKQVQGRPPISVDIDESIVDVGITESGELKTGSDSASLSEGEVVQDQSLQKSKSKLRQLKRK